MQIPIKLFGLADLLFKCSGSYKPVEDVMYSPSAKLYSTLLFHKPEESPDRG